MNLILFLLALVSFCVEIFALRVYYGVTQLWVKSASFHLSGNIWPYLFALRV